MSQNTDQTTGKIPPGTAPSQTLKAKAKANGDSDASAEAAIIADVAAKVAPEGNANLPPEVNASPVTADPATWPNASRGKKFVSMMYEGALLFGVVFTADYLFDVLTQSKHALMFRPGRQAWLFIAIGAYFLLCWHRSGQTLPMRAWHIKLVSASGSRPPLRQLLSRYLMLWPVPLAGMVLIYALVLVTKWPAIYTFAIATPFLVFIPSWFTADGQFLHDSLAGTRIVDIPEHLRHGSKNKKTA